MLKISKKFIKYVERNSEFALSVSDGYADFAFCSPAGQDFHMEIDLQGISSYEELTHAIYQYWDGFDVSTEASYWLDESGHGKNGAPYAMADVVADMQACADAINDLWDTVSHYRDAYLKGKETARRDAIFWQDNFAEKDWSYEELLQAQTRFEKLGRRYGLLSEFKENGII